MEETIRSARHLGLVKLLGMIRDAEDHKPHAVDRIRTALRVKGDDAKVLKIARETVHRVASW